VRLWSSLVALCLYAVAAEASASVCCGDPAGLGERLGRFEIAAASIGQDLRYRVGSYDDEGSFAGMPAGDSELGLRTRAAWTVRVAKPLEIGITLPLITTFASKGGTSDQRIGVGDAVFGARVTLLPVPVYELWPGVALTTAVVAPLGRPSWRSESAIGADVSGQGVPELRFGLVLEEAIEGSWFVLASGTLGLFAASDAGGREVQRAPRVGVQLVTGPTFEGLAFGAGVEHEREASPSVAGKDGSGGRRQTNALATAIVDVGEGLALVPTLRVALPIESLGRAEKADIISGIALRMGWEAR